MGCECQGSAEGSDENRLRAVSETAEEPLVALYESESSESPSVFGFGPCAPTASGVPSLLRIESFSASGIRAPSGHAHHPTEFELPKSLQDRYAQGNVRGVSACGLPWVRVTRDPATFGRCLAAARALGPIKTGRQVHKLFRDALYRNPNDSMNPLVQDQEVFYVLMLDTQGKVRGIGEISRGARDRVQTPIADVLRLPIVTGAIGFIVVHNHPSGKVKPSDADKEITKVIRDAGETVGVPLIDHVIIGPDSHYSFLESTRLIK